MHRPGEAVRKLRLGIPNRCLDLCLYKSFGQAEIGSFNMRSLELCKLEISAFKIDPPEISSAEICRLEEDSIEVRAVEKASLQICASKKSSLEIRCVEVRPFKVGFKESSFFKI